MCFQDVTFLPTKTRFHMTFLENCGRCVGLRMTRYLKTVFGGRKGHSPCEILGWQLCSSRFYLFIACLNYGIYLYFF